MIIPARDCSGRRSIHRRSRCSVDWRASSDDRHLERSRGERALRGSHPLTIIARDAKQYTYTCTCTHVHAPAHVHQPAYTYTQESTSHHSTEGSGGRKKEGEGTSKSRTRETRESLGKPATALDGRRDHTLTSTPTFRGPPPDTYLTFLVRLLHLIHHLRSRTLKSERRGRRERHGKRPRRFAAACATRQDSRGSAACHVRELDGASSG